MIMQEIVDTIAKFNNGTGITEIYYFETERIVESSSSGKDSPYFSRTSFLSL